MSGFRLNKKSCKILNIFSDQCAKVYCIDIMELSSQELWETTFNHKTLLKQKCVKKICSYFTVYFSITVIVKLLFILK